MIVLQNFSAQTEELRFRLVWGGGTACKERATKIKEYMLGTSHVNIRVTSGDWMPPQRNVAIATKHTSYPPWNLYSDPEPQSPRQETLESPEGSPKETLRNPQGPLHPEAL